MISVIKTGAKLEIKIKYAVVCCVLTALKEKVKT